MKTIIAPFALAALGTAAIAQETRELGAHEHGHSALNIAVDGNRVAIELDAPGADIVGFEYEATSAEDRAKIAAGIAALSEPLSLFVMPDAAGCSVTEASARLVSDQADGHDEDHQHAEDHAGDEGNAAGEAHHDHTDETGHTEFRAEYLLTCADPGAIDAIDFAFFATFPNAEEVDVRMISDSGSQAFEVVRDAPVLDLAGRI